MGVQRTGASGAPRLINVATCIAEPISATKVGTWIPLSFGTSETTGYPFNGGALSNSSASSGDLIEYGIVLSAGNYNISFYNRKSSNVGIMTNSIDGSSLGAVDLYAASPAYLKTSYNGVALSEGYHVFQLKVTGKNASSAGFAVQYFGFSLARQ